MNSWQNAAHAHLIRNGLRRSTEQDVVILKECMASSVSLTSLWEDVNDEPKIIKWDSDWEKYLEHRAALIDEEDRKRYLPWNAYNELGLDWLDGYNFVQNSGDCASFGNRNSLKASNFTNALRTGRKPREIAHSMVYAIARGNGQPQFGSGCNLNPMSKWAATKGNYWTEDFGRYDTGAYCRKYKKGSEQDAHALKTQSIIVYLPEPTFEFCYKATRAGFGINTGTETFPGGSTLNKDNLAQVSSWDRGGHSIAAVCAWEGESGKPYVYLENSHPTHYATDSLNTGHQWGCWCDENDVNRMGRAGGFEYGTWYVNIGELVKD